jgi:flagellar biosynthetic protein FlhB
MAGDKSQKTEAPTPRRIKEGREKGQVAKSQDLSTWAAMLATIVLLQMTVTRGASSMRAVLEDMRLAIAHPNQAGAMKFAADAAWKSVGVLTPMLLGMMVIGVVVGLGQVGLKPAVKKLKLEFGRVYVLKGFLRLFFTEVLLELT